MKYIKIASATADTTEKLKLISTGLIGDMAGPMVLCLGQPPLPSFPGEFLEGYLKDGTFIKIVQIRRAGDPVNTKIQVTGPEDCYKIECEISAFAKPWSITDPNCIIAGQRRFKWEITMKDGTLYSYVKLYLPLLIKIGSTYSCFPRLSRPETSSPIFQ